MSQNKVYSVTFQKSIPMNTVWRESTPVPSLNTIVDAVPDPIADMQRHEQICYSIDQDDHIISVNEAWNSFATDNEGGHLLSEKIIGMSLWAFITNEETRHLYRNLLAKVRRGVPIALRLRCDGPTNRRTIEITMSARPQSQVDFVCSICADEPRDRIKLLDTRSQHSSTLLSQCSWCNKIQLPDNSWAEIEIAVERLRLFESSFLPGLTHGICEECEARLFAGFDTLDEVAHTALGA